MIKVNLDKTTIKNEINSYEKNIKEAHATIKNKTGKGSDFLG
jgi:hypothetical protein